MDKEKINKEMDKLLKNKKFVNCLIVLLVVIFLSLALNSFISYGANKNNSNNKPIGAQEVVSSESSMSQAQLVTYEKEQKEELKEILKKIEGVGEVEVMIYFESGEVSVPAINNNTQVSETNEADNQGGSRTITSQTDGSNVVMKTDGNKTEPFITKVYKPQITGVVVVAEGAQSNKTKYDIQQAVSSLYNLSLDKVNVYPMSS